MINHEHLPQRFNVSYAVSGQVLSAILDCNAIINKVGSGEIRFQPSGAAFPHITMVMGVVKNEGSLLKISELLNSLAPNLDPILYKLGQPYLADSNSSGTWVFTDVEPADHFLNQRLKLADMLADHMEFDRFGKPDNVSHITLGYVTDNLEGEVLSTLPNLQNLTEWATTLQLAETGSRGACINSLASYVVGGRASSGVCTSLHEH